MNRFERHPRITLLIAGLVFSIVTLAALEWTLTLFHEELGIERPAKSSTLRYLPMREWGPGRAKTFGAPENRKQDPLGPIQETYQLRTDPSGFIEPSVVHDTPDMEVAFLGGSTTECLYVRPEMRFPYLVGRILEQRTGLRTNGLNAAKSGNHVLHSTINYLGKVAPREPRFVVLMHATNDIGALGGNKTYWNQDSSIAIVQDRANFGKRRPLEDILEPVRDRMIPYSFAVARQGYAVVRLKLAKLFRSDEADTDAAPRPRQSHQAQPAGPAEPDQAEIKRRKEFRKSFEPALEGFVRLAKAWRSQPVLMTQILVTENARKGETLEGAFLSPEALERGNFDHASFSSLHEYANAIVRHVARSEGALLIDLSAARQWGDEDVYDGIHFTETGSRRVAEIIADVLGRHIAGGSEPVNSADAPVVTRQN